MKIIRGNSIDIIDLDGAINLESLGSDGRLNMVSVVGFSDMEILYNLLHSKLQQEYVDLGEEHD